MIQSFWSVVAGRKVFRDAAALYGGQGINLFIGLLATLIYGIIFSKVEIAILGLFQMVAQLALSLGFTWSVLGITRFGKGELHERQTMHETSTTRLVIMVPILIIVGFVMLAFRSNLQSYIGSTDTRLVVFLLVFLVVQVLTGHFTSLFRTAERHEVNASILVARSLGNIVFLLLFYLGVLEISAELYIKLQVYLESVLVAAQACFLKRSYLFPLSGVTQERVRRYLQYVLPQIFGFAGLYIINWVDIYFIRKYGTMAELGTYQFLYTVFAKGASLAMLVNTLFFPKVMTWKESAPEKLQAYLQRVPWVVLWSSMLMTGGAFLFYGPVFDFFFQDKFIVGYPAFNLLLLALPFCFLINVFLPVLNGHDRVAFIQLANIVAALSNYVVDFFFVPRIGLTGAALGTFVAYALKAILVMHDTRKFGDLNTGWLSFGALLLVVCVTLSLLYGLH